MAEPNPINIFRCGLIVSSATSWPRPDGEENQMAKGRAAKAPVQPLGQSICAQVFPLKIGQGGAGKNEHTNDGNYRDAKLERSRRPYAVNIQACKDEVGEYGDTRMGMEGMKMFR